jgi:CheY-like chemotaxis protein/anti-sigma regulatory factor (Ser/Thr protein kinase)
MGVDLLLQHQADQVPIVASTLAAMDRQLDHMVRLIDDLMDLSRISRGVFELKKERADLGEIVHRAVENTRPFLERHNHTISVTIGRCATTQVDSTRVAQILGNLLHNAAKFTPDGGRISVELASEEDQAIVRVIDSGQGIPTNDLDRVFEMFSQLDRGASHGERGLGIGLALARRLAEMHGGTLTAASAGIGLGTTFTLRLPIAVSAGQGLVPRAVKPATDEPVASLRVVVIEDHEDIADVLAAWLENQGHLVQVARSGPSGIDLVRDARPDLVFCDLGLPDLDGVEVCRRVRNLDLSPQPVMVAITGWGRDADRQQTTEAGFDHHLVKPVAADKLRNVLRRLSRGEPERGTGSRA